MGTRPRIRPNHPDMSLLNPTYVDNQVNVFGEEKYTIKEARTVYYYRRKEAVLATREKAIEKKRDFTILVNGTPFCMVFSTGECVYIYDPSQDFASSPYLKQLFISKGFAVFN